MRLPRVRILQVGDVHLPTAAQARRNVDQKDKSFSVELRNIISSVPTKVVFKQIYELLQRNDVDAILFMGDLTDLGSLENYEKCSAFLANALQIGDGRIHEDIAVGIVPGNHDINRELARNPGLETKFQPLNTALAAHQLPALPVTRSVAMPLQRGVARVQINLLNSCWGCGALEYIPEQFRVSIAGAIDQAITSGGVEPLRAYYDRQFDTPAFSNETIQDLVQAARTTDPNALLIVVAHHNLLPQRLTRLAPYTELVNSGALRSSLMSSGRPALYLHGHIHEDPVEVLSVPEGDSLICISAPAAEDGFNVLDVTFTRTGIPLSCQIEPWRFDGSGILAPGNRISLPLIGKRRRSHDRTLGKIFSYLLDIGEVYWNDILTKTPPFFADDNEGNIQEALELLRADNSIVVENYDLDPVNWIVRANV